MTLPLNGNSIKLSEIQSEFGGTDPISISEYYSGAGKVRTLTAGFPGGISTNIPTSGPLKLSNFHGSSSAVPITYTVVGGGGAGGGSSFNNSTGGYGGQVRNGTTTVSSYNTQLSVTVGAGGISGVYSSTPPPAGGTSILSSSDDVISVSSLGGKGGTATMFIPQAYAGPSYAGAGTYTSGPGTSTITGSSVTYGTTGAVGTSVGLNANPIHGATNTGNGGSGVWTQLTGSGRAGGNGGSGIVYIRYKNNVTLTVTSGNLVYTTITIGGDKLTSFKSGSGTFTLS